MRVLVTGGTGYLGSELVRLGADVVQTAYRQDAADAWAVNVDGSRIVPRRRQTPVRD